MSKLKMTLGLLVRCRYWSILQVVAIIVYYRGRVTSETVVKGCVGSQLNLSCAEMKIIHITAVALGVSDCSGASCCPKDSDCTRSSSESHTTDVHRKCDNEESCTVTAVQERIHCASWGWRSINNHFESITYICVDHPQYIAEGCVGSRINLSCEKTKVIQITSVVLGDSDCNGASCCIKNSDCTRNANVNRRTDVRRTCDNEQICVVEVLQDRIGCGLYGDYIFWSNNDFERITYICVNETRNDTMNSTAEQESSEGDYKYDHKSEFAEGCVGTRLNLTCEEMKVINITAVIVGISVGSACSIRPAVCISYANESHTLDLHRRCNDRSNCTIDVFNEVIPCELEFSSNNSVEHIRYDCVGSPRNDMTSIGDTFTRPNNNKEAYNEDDTERTTNQPNSHDMTSTDGTFRRPNNNNEAYNECDTGQMTAQPNYHTLPVVVVIICLIILLTVVVLFIVYRRKQRAQVKSFNPVAMTETGNQQYEPNIHPNGSQTTSIHENENNVPLYLALVEEDPPVYSEMVWKDDLSNRAAADQPKAAIQAHVTGPDVYTEVNKPSKTTATASALETGRVGGTGPVKTGDCFADQISSLASNDVGNIYANEPAADSETVSLQDDDGQTVIENDLYNL